MPKLKKVGLFAKKGNERAEKLAQSLLPLFKKKGVQAFYSNTELSTQDLDLLFTFGGDGTFLKSARFLHGSKVPILGVNLGQFGFLSQLLPENIEKKLDSIIEGKFKVEERLKLRSEVIRKNKIQATFHSLNDIVLHTTGVARISKYSVTINSDYLTTLKADGVLVATPTGSTAYAYAAGGPIVEPHNPLMLFAPICPQQLFNRPIVLGKDTQLEIELVAKNSGVLLTSDGQEQHELEVGDKIKVQKSDQVAYFAWLPETHYFEVLRKKILLHL